MYPPNTHSHSHTRTYFGCAISKIRRVGFGSTYEAASACRMAKCSILIYPAQSSNNNNNNTAPKTTSTTKISTFDACVPIMPSNFFLLLCFFCSIYHQWFLDCNLYRKCMRSHTGSCMYGCACASVRACVRVLVPFFVFTQGVLHTTQKRNLNARKPNANERRRKLNHWCYANGFLS